MSTFLSERKSLLSSILFVVGLVMLALSATTTSHAGQTIKGGCWTNLDSFADNPQTGRLVRDLNGTQGGCGQNKVADQVIYIPTRNGVLAHYSN